MKVRAIYKEVGKRHKIRNVDFAELTEIDSSALPDKLSDMTLSGFNSEKIPYGLYGTLMLPHSKSVVAGGFVITGVDDNGERCSLTDEQIGRIGEYLSVNEINEKLELGTVYGLMYDMLDSKLCKMKKEAEM